MQNVLTHLKSLSELCGASGSEDAVRNYIVSVIGNNAKINIDPLGNIIGLKKGRKTPPVKLMIAAHMDEVVLIVTYVMQDGTLKFSTVGGICTEALTGCRVKIGQHYGVIGLRAVHNLSADEKDKMPEADSLFIGIGAKSREEAEKIISVGDYAYFTTEYSDFGDGKILGKALDDRAGCAILLNMILNDCEYDFHFAFTVQEEIGTRGAKTAAFSVAPDYAIVLEATTAADIPDVSDEKRVCSLGKGVAVSFMDRSTIYDRELYRLANEISKDKNIPCQTKSLVAGGNDSGAIHISGKGVKTIAVSVPCRYLHSPLSVISKSDLLAVMNLSSELAVRICSADRGHL
jgi:endoglucanase